MLNQVILAGRLVSDPEIVTTENNYKRTYVTVAVPRSYKNIDGTYDTDFIRCTLWNAIAETTCEYCKKGDVVGVRGRLQVSYYEKDGVNHKAVEVIVEKLTFLSSKHQDETEEADD